MSEEVAAAQDDKLLGDAVSSLTASGLPFQLAVEEGFRQLESVSAFPIAREVPWSNPRAGLSGFVDIVVDSNSAIFCAIECKSSRDRSPLVFMRRTGEPAIEWAPYLFRDPKAEEARYYVWLGDGNVKSTMAAFAVGKDSEHRLLESVASSCIAAAEALADDPAFRPEAGRVFFLPVLVTNRPIVVCDIDPARVDLASGRATGDAVAPIRVPFVRFQKSFVGREEAGEIKNADKLARREIRRGYSLRIRLARSERCLWVVDATELPAFGKFLLALGADLPSWG